MKLGILGGGQLGRMMMPTLRELNIEHSVLDPHPTCPCHQVADKHVVGDFRDYDTVINFGKNVDTITIEIEQVNVDALEELQKQGKTVWPSPAMIRLIQNKHEQKKFFIKHNIPTSDFMFVPDHTKLKNHTDFLPFAQKACTGGYDGQGVMLHRKKISLEEGLKTESIIERLVDIEQELSVIVARNKSGEIKTFPTVGQTFDPAANLVKFVYAPADINIAIDKECQNIAKDLAEKFELVGLLAVEFFLNKDGKILVNEVAPRCHNSGHWTQNGCTTSQFEQLIRAVTGLPLGKTNITKPTVMVNLLGAPNYKGKPNTDFFTDVLAIADTHIHWYGKTESKPMRKMGHVNVCGNTIIEATQNAEKVFNIANAT
jgi:5-(carboxyamino)imidazole ribonucleotide synthase